MNPDHLPKLHWLANKVVSEILKDKNFKVFTPDVQQIGNIMDHVIRSADRAELVVADTTGNNPNVLYEIAILDAMGRACVLVKQNKNEGVEQVESQADENRKENDKMAFDRAQYRYFSVTTGETDQAIEKLRDVIEDTLKRQEESQIQENPLTNFFRAPLNSMAPTRGLVTGYFDNFIMPTLKGKVTEGPPFCVGADDLSLEIVIPNKVRLANRSRVERLKVKKIILPVTLEADGREVKAFVWNPELSGNHDIALLDIPTALVQLEENVRMRLGLQDLNVDADDYKLLEKDEIKQFLRYLKHKINENIRDVNIERRLKVLMVDECRNPGMFDI
ncbi:STING domain-containing protein [Synechococcus sp. CCFWC 502]|nr:STING domain-containing protein [Synechococcus sp. CCFWC 502]WFN57855.1 hypothetical protein N4320_08295 [Synechococcus sp. CCFWC 502]